MNPPRKRSTMNPGKLLTKAVGTCKTQKMAKGMMYGRFRPICGISVMGAKTSGPIPYPTTGGSVCTRAVVASGEDPSGYYLRWRTDGYDSPKMERPRILTISLTPKNSAPAAMAGE